MAQSRKRPGHPHHKTAAIPSRQRVRGRMFSAVLFTVFGLLMAYFAAGGNYIVLGIVGIVSALIGYFVGKRMEQDAVK